MPHSADILLLADWGEIIGTLVFLGIMALRYLLSDGDNQKGAPPRKKAPPKPANAGEQDQMRAEIDDFLRRSKGLPPREAEQAEHAEDQTQPTQAARPWQDRMRLDTEADTQQLDPRETSVADHVEQHVGRLKESQLAEQAARLGYDLSQTDERLEARLEAKFKHRLGKLDRGEDATPAAPAVDEGVLGAEKIAAMLVNPEGIRNAVVLNEILSRPVDKW